MPNQLFEQLKTRLVISPHRIDEELIEMPQFIEMISEQVAEAVQKRDKANNDLKFIIAEESDKLRRIEEGGKKPSEKQIESDVLLLKTVRQATYDLENAKHELALWQGLMEAARSKSTAMEMYARLWMAGYLTPNTVMQSSRAELAERRAQRPALVKRQEQSKEDR
jgi:hypothetical protein